MQRFEGPDSAQRFLSSQAAVYNTFDVQRHVTIRPYSPSLSSRGDEHVANGRCDGLK